MASEARRIWQQCEMYTFAKVRHTQLFFEKTKNVKKSETTQIFDKYTGFGDSQQLVLRQVMSL
jgi:hypothetical protein